MKSLLVPADWLAPLLLKALIAEPLVFIAVWLLGGWLLLQLGRPGPGDTGPTEPSRADPPESTDGVSGLELVLLFAASYYLLRYWRNR